MSDCYILNENNQAVPVDHITWANWYEAADRCVAEHRNKLRTVSTVFLGLDHQFGGGPPLIFETMVFTTDTNDPADGICERYSTWNEALKGHAEVCKNSLGDMKGVTGKTRLHWLNNTTSS